MPESEIFKQYTVYLAWGVEGCAAMIIALATLQAMYRSLKLFFAHPPQPEERKTEVRLQLGRWLTLGLEFELAADILLTAVAPTWEEIGKLAAIAALRTALNFFLEREIRSSGQR